MGVSGRIVRVEVNQELNYCENEKKSRDGDGGGGGVRRGMVMMDMN